MLTGKQVKWVTAIQSNYIDMFFQLKFKFRLEVKD